MKIPPGVALTTVVFIILWFEKAVMNLWTELKWVVVLASWWFMNCLYFLSYYASSSICWPKILNILWSAHCEVWQTTSPEPQGSKWTKCKSDTSKNPDCLCRTMSPRLFPELEQSAWKTTWICFSETTFHCVLKPLAQLQCNLSRHRYSRYRTVIQRAREEQDKVINSESVHM